MTTFKLTNPYLGSTSHLYHIGLMTTDNLKQRFGDVKYVCMGGKPERMKHFAEIMLKKLACDDRCEFEKDGEVLKDIASEAGRYSMYKVGPLLSVSHGIGMGSLSVILHEIFKLLCFAETSDVKFFRLGTSGGLGVTEGTIVITKQTHNAMLEPFFRQMSCGKIHKLDSSTDMELTRELLNCGKRIGLLVEEGNTMTSHDFFEGQARLDGAFCDFSKQDKLDFLHKAHHEFGIKNFEMESLCFSAMCRRAGLKCAVACVCVVNRLLHDDVTEDHEQLHLWEENLSILMSEFISQDVQRHLQN